MSDRELATLLIEAWYELAADGPPPVPPTLDLLVPRKDEDDAFVARSCTAKRWWGTEAAAAAFLATRGKGHEGCRPYPCRRCGRWHVGHGRGEWNSEGRLMRRAVAVMNAATVDIAAVSV